ncbi:MAG: CPBP family intramembrane metalloprotease [Clostridiales bacterium]|nr:CPBP family intramembrane metalloprotease [Roseburia sp.]MDD7637986.1 CPBP family intramembrane metalloprotease [Clostridiales bacterium]MDY4113793.1 CPBP family intramembrane glutamic endopeptidase [Roseburia sp.]
MKKTGVYRVWQVIYPIGIYYVVSSIVYFFLGMLLGNNQETYMLRQMVCGAVTIPFILSFYKQDKQFEDTVYGKKKFSFDAQTIWEIVLSVSIGAMLGIAVNNLIAMTPLMEISAGFKEANDSFFAGGVVYELLGSCLVIPIAEELLYRGVVFKRLRVFLGVWPAILLSAIIFGAVHANLVQFLYAGILGVLLAYLLQSTGKLYAPILGHIAANVAAVIRQETGWLDFAYEPTAAGIGFSLLLLVATAGALVLWNRKLRATG